MFGNTTIALIFSIGFAGWVYAKMQKQTGGNTKTAIIVAVGAALVAFLILGYLLSLIPQAEA